jgi:hypothetical protein
MNATKPNLKPHADAGDLWGTAWLGCGGIAVELLIAVAALPKPTHLIVTTLVWLAIAAAIVWYGRHSTGANPFAEAGRPITNFGKISVLIASLVTVAIMTYGWGGLKPAIEYQKLGWLYFTLQYVYYAAEAFLMTIMVVYAQRAAEVGHRSDIPWGGLFLAVAWGIFHLSKGVGAGLSVMVMAVLYGVIHLGLARNARLTYLFIAALFVL